MTATSHRLGAAAIATVPLIVAMSKVIGTYDREDLLVRKSTLDEAPALFQLATLYSLTVWLIDGTLAGGALQRRGLFFLWVATLLLLLAFRAAARSLSRWVTPSERCLVVGDEDACVWMQTKFARRPSLHATVVGSVSPLHMRPRADGPTLASPHDLRALAGRLDIDRLVITADSADEPGIVDVVHTATTVGLKVSVLPRVLEVVGTSVEIDDIEGVPLLSMRPLSLPRSSRIVKRALDLVGSVLGLLVLSPLLAAISAAILLDSGGPILFRQRRIGRDGQPFEMVKFRTMVPDAEDRKNSLAHLNQASGLFKIADDPRIDPRRAVPAPHLARRASPAPQRRERRDEPRRPAPAGRRGGRDDRGLAPPPAAPHSRDDRPLADPRLGPAAARRDGPDRLPVRDQLVAVGGRQDPAADGAVRAGAARNVAVRPILNGPSAPVPTRGG